MAEALTERLLNLANELSEAQADATKAEEAFKLANARIRCITELLAEEVEDLGLRPGASLPTEYGILKLGEKLSASISKDSMPLAVQWLDSHGEGGMVKRQVSIMFNRDQEEQASALSNRLKDEYDVKTEHSIHNSTLRAWVNKRLKNGKPVPDSISYHVMKTIELKPGV